MKPYAATHYSILGLGQDFALGMTWRDSDGKPVDLTGAYAVLKIQTASGPYADDSRNPLTSIRLGGTTGTISLRATAAALGTDGAAASANGYDVTLQRIANFPWTLDVYLPDKHWWLLDGTIQVLKLVEPARAAPSATKSIKNPEGHVSRRSDGPLLPPPKPGEVRVSADGDGNIRKIHG